MSSMMRGHLRMAILNSLENNSLSGAEMMKKLEQDIGWKPSCGSIYPVLSSLVDESLATVKADKKSTKKIYSITKKGILELKKHNDNKEELVNEFTKIHKMIETTYGVNLKMVNNLKDSLKSGNPPFGPVHKEAEELKDELITLVSEGVVSSKAKEIKEIIKDTTDRLRKLRREEVLRTNMRRERGRV